MHELALAHSIAEAGQKELTERGLRRITAIHVSVGGLNHVQPGNLVFCFSSIVGGTELAGCELVVHVMGMEATCNRCGRTFEVVKGDFKCPDCGVADVKLVGDSELTLTSIEAETDEEEEEN